MFSLLGAEWMSRISLSCFAFSYAITMILEISRIFFRVPVRWAVIVLITVAGLFAHGTFIWLKMNTADGGTPVASWQQWCLIVSLGLAIIYLIIALRRPENAFGVFFLPVILALILIAMAADDTTGFDKTHTTTWSAIHGFSLLAGTISVALGFVAGIMYLIQAYRLKHKLPPRAGFRLPSLEWLQNSNRRTLWLSTALLAIGLLSGIIINIQRHAGSEAGIPWTNAAILSSAALFMWLIATSIFEYVYRPARQGQKIAYLTIASFVFLAFVLTFVILGDHASGTASTSGVEVSQQEAGS